MPAAFSWLHGSAPEPEPIVESIPKVPCETMTVEVEDVEELPIGWMRRGESEVWSVPIQLSFGPYVASYAEPLQMERDSETTKLDAGLYSHRNFYEHWYRESFWYYGRDSDRYLFQWTLCQRLRTELTDWMKVENVPAEEQSRYLQNFDHVWRTVGRAEKLGKWNAPKTDKEDIRKIIQENPLPQPLASLLQILASNRRNMGDEEIRLLLQLTEEKHPSFEAFPVRAHFLLGLALLHKDPSAARQQFQTLQEKVKKGAADPDQCVVQSYGWEAMAPYQQKDYLSALHGYLNANRKGFQDWTSIRFTLRDMTREPEEVWKNYLDDKVAVRLLTVRALALDRKQEREPFLGRWMPLVWDSPHLQEELYLLALAAYELGEKERCAEYLERIEEDRENGVTLFLRARLALEAGQEEQAMAYYNQVLLEYAPRRVHAGAHYWEYEIWGEGVYRAIAERAFLHLKRNEYLQAMAWLAYVREGDVAMMAERILTLDELIAYAENPKRDFPGADWSGLKQCEAWITKYPVELILARRLAREDRWEEATAWFEKAGQKESAIYARQIFDWKKQLAEENLSNDGRSDILWQIAQRLYESGMDLVGTEYAPDYVIERGRRDFPAFYRAEVFRVRKPFPYSEETLQRIAESAPEPDLRWHYRYVAAEYGWQAAQLLPNNDERTAQILWQSGRWVMYQNPQYADRFYKSLVRRNRKTELGKEADRLRWFPKEWPLK